MAILRIDTDKPSDMAKLSLLPRTDNGLMEVRQRRDLFASATAIEAGAVPIHDKIDELPDPDDFSEIIEECHNEKLFPMYHQKEVGWREVQGWNQDGLGFCWAYGISAALMDLRAYAKLPMHLLAPESLGWLVNWRNQGYWLLDTIRGAAERGIAEREYVPNHSLNYRNYKDGWEQNALLHRPTEWWDTNRSLGAIPMAQQCLAGLRMSFSGYVAYNWWGHALSLAGLNHNPNVLHNLEWILNNSHAEDDLIILTGSRAVPDECYFCGACA